MPTMRMLIARTPELACAPTASVESVVFTSSPEARAIDYLSRYTSSLLRRGNMLEAYDSFYISFGCHPGDSLYEVSTVAQVLSCFCWG